MVNRKDEPGTWRYGEGTIHHFAGDESPRELGSRFQLPEQFESRRAELLDQLEPIQVADRH